MMNPYISKYKNAWNSLDSFQKTLPLGISVRTEKVVSMKGAENLKIFGTPINSWSVSVLFVALFEQDILKSTPASHNGTLNETYAINRCL